MSHCQTTKKKSHSERAVPGHWATLEMGLIFIDILQGFSLLLAFLLVRPQQCYVNEYTHITSFEYLSSVVQMSLVNKPTTNATAEMLSWSYVLYKMISCWKVWATWFDFVLIKVQ